MESSVLEPCRLALEFSLSSSGEGTDVRLDASDLRLT